MLSRKHLNYWLEHLTHLVRKCQVLSFCLPVTFLPNTFFLLLYVFIMFYRLFGNFTYKLQVNLLYNLLRYGPWSFWPPYLPSKKEKKQVQFVLPIRSLEYYQTLKSWLLKEKWILTQFSAPTRKPSLWRTVIHPYHNF